YRRAMPLEKALAIVVSESGKSFDPKIVEIIQRRARELEKKARAESMGEAPPVKLSKDLKIERGLAPGAGFEETTGSDRPAGGALSNGDAPYSPTGIATAQQQMQALYDFTHSLGSSLNGYETLSLLCARLQRLVPHDCVAIYVRRGQRLKACCAHGENSRLFASLEIPVGQ